MTSILSCLADRKPVGRSTCTKLPQQIKGFILTAEDFSLTDTQAKNSADWQAAILAAGNGRIYMFPFAQMSEVTSEDAVYEENSLGTRSVRDGRYRFRLGFEVNLYQHKNIFSFKRFDGRIFLIDNENKLIGTELASGNFAGFLIDLFNPEKLTFNDGSVVSKSMVYISLEDNRELDASGAMYDGTFVRTLTPLTPAYLTVGSASSTSISVTVKSAIDDVPVLGLESGDFILKTAAGAAQTISGVTEVGEGVYTLAGTGLETGTVTLAAAADLSVVGFESTGPVVVTIA